VPPASTTELRPAGYRCQIEVRSRLGLGLSCTKTSAHIAFADDGRWVGFAGIPALDESFGFRGVCLENR
jgi:hypothetical protein